MFIQHFLVCELFEETQTFMAVVCGLPTGDQLESLGKKVRVE